MVVSVQCWTQAAQNGGAKQNWGSKTQCTSFQGQEWSRCLPWLWDEEKWMQVPGVDKVDEGGSFACVNMLSCTSWELRNCFCVWD